MKWISLLATIVGLALALLPGSAQLRIRSDQPDMTVSPTLRAEVINSVLKYLNEGYVFPDVAKKMEEVVRERDAKGEYKEIDSAKKLSAKLTEDLRAVSHDKHLRVIYSHEPIPTESSEPTAEDRRKRERFARSNNHGFERVERMAGNVGYLKFNGFTSPEQGAETVTAAMNFLSNCDALIIDVRQNGGGSPEMVAFICSYLLPAEPGVHLNDIYERPDNSTRQFWTLPSVPGKRFLDKPVYVLTSNYTFSAAEEFTYNLKTQKRATIVGETTGGGAHPVNFRPVATNFAVSVPFARAINPITKTNWEGTGVKPDIDVAAAEALKTAHVDALKKLIAKEEDADAKGDLQRALDSVEKGDAKK
jgi:Periplasmic protease